MKSLFIILFSVSRLFNQNPVPAKVTEVLNQLQNKYAPDKRTSIFNIKANTSTTGKIVLTGELAGANIRKELLTALKSFNILDSLQMLPEKELGTKIYGVITIPVANMRANPGHNQEMVDQLLCGSVVRLYKSSGSWTLSQSPDDYLGWIDNDAIVPLDTIALKDYLSKPKLITIRDQSYIVDKPGDASNIVSPLSIGAIITLLNKSGNFYEVALADGRKGYINTGSVNEVKKWKEETKTQLQPNQVIKTAFNFLGRPYLWGGTSGNGMDCSGFTKMVYYLHGLVLPRDASQQVRVGKPIPSDTTLKNILPGDLLFFGRHASNDKPEKVTHVAMYLGDGKIIHSSGYVRVQSLKRGDPDFTESRLHSFLQARRPLAAPKENGIPSLSDLHFFD